MSGGTVESDTNIKANRSRLAIATASAPYLVALRRLCPPIAFENSKEFALWIGTLEDPTKVKPTYIAMSRNKCLGLRSPTRYPATLSLHLLGCGYANVPNTGLKVLWVYAAGSG
jgi:hypothetical protein